MSSTCKETESGRGIMEEPELTFVSSNDISTAESDAEHTNQEGSSEDKTKNPACADRSAISVLTEVSLSSAVGQRDCNVLKFLSVFRSILMLSLSISGVFLASAKGKRLSFLVSCPC